MNEIEALNDEIAQLKAQLKQATLAYQMAVQMSQFKAGFLARTSHELRSPLNSLIGLHQLILSDLCDSPEEEREFVHQAHQSALKLIHLMDEIIDVAKADYGNNPLELHPIPLDQVFEEVSQLTHLQAANRGFPLTFAAPKPNLFVVADEQRLLQVLVALIDTSIVYMEEGSIQVSARRSEAGDRALIWLDLPSQMKIWSEPTDLVNNPKLPPTPETAKEQILHSPKTPSPGMNFLLAQTLLDLMKGELDVLCVPSSTEGESTTRLQCSLPLATVESIALELRGDF